MTLTLRAALSSYRHIQPIKTGLVPIPGVRMEFTEFDNMVDAYRKMVRNVEFDVCEMAPTTYLMARALGAPYQALPIFVMRRFHHSGFVVRREANIRRPTDLHGKSAGVRAYSVTSAVWTRGILAEEYGVDLSKVTWVTAEDDHVLGLPTPPNVSRISPGQTLAGLIENDRLDAAFTGAPGLGKMGGAESGFTQVDGVDPERYPALFPDAASLEIDWYRRTKIYPLHGLIVVKSDILATNPWLASTLGNVFQKAKDIYLKELSDGSAKSAEDERYRILSRIVGDPLPYGISENLASINALFRFSHNQGFLPRLPTLADAFYGV